MMYVIHESRLLRMHAATMRFGKEKTYTVDEFMTDLNKGLFAELQTRQTG